MKKNKIHFGFTLVELIVVISILAILSTIGFISYKEYLTQSRDTNRVTSLSTISKGLKYYFLKNSKYPNPDNSLGIGQINGIDLSKTGYIGEKITRLVSLKNKPVDPFSGDQFSYGVSYNNKNFQLAATTEGLLSHNILLSQTYAEGGNKAYVVGNYEGLVKKNGILYNVPSLIFSGSLTGGNVDLLSTDTYFIVNNSYNVPYKLLNSESITPQPTSEILLNVLGTSTGSITSFDINNLDWNTSSGILAETLGYNTDKLGLFLYGEKFTPTLWTPPVKSTGSTNPGQTPPPTGSSGVVLFSLDFETDTGYTVTEGTFNRVIDPENGTYVLESGNHADGSRSCFHFNLTTAEQSEINFDFLESGENNYDFFEFYINGIIKKKVSGNLGWDSFNNNTKPLAPGDYTFKFCYSKYGSVSSYQDKAMVDNIIVKTNSYVKPAPVVGSNPYVECLNMNETHIQNLNTFFDGIGYGAPDFSTFEEQRDEYCSRTYLDIGWYDAEYLPVEIGYLNNLDYLDISGNLFTELPSSIGYLSNLTELNVSEMTTLSVLPDTISDLTSLEYFRMRDSSIEELPANFGNLLSLTEFDGSSSALSSLPSSFGNLANLQYLRLRGSSIQTLPETLGNLSSIIELDLGETLITSLPESIGNLSTLESLRIRGNNLTSLPDSIGNLTNIYEIDVSSNALSSLPSSFTGLTTLNTLRIDFNEFTSVPEQVLYLTGLTSLDVQSNMITQLPENIGNLANLDTLYADNNNLTSLPETLGNLTQLTFLQINHNNLTSLPETFGNLVNLQTLYINNNNLSSLPSSFGNLDQLNYLQINDNSFSSFPSEIFTFTLLSNLSIGGNLFNSLPTEIGSMTNLRNLYVNSGSLTSLPPSIINLNLYQLDLGNNPGLGTLNRSFYNWNTVQYSQNFPGVGTFTMKGNYSKILITHTP